LSDSFLEMKNPAKIGHSLFNRRALENLPDWLPGWSLIFCFLTVESLGIFTKHTSKLFQRSRLSIWVLYVLWWRYSVKSHKIFGQKSHWVWRRRVGKTFKGLLSKEENICLTISPKRKILIRGRYHSNGQPYEISSYLNIFPHIVHVHWVWLNKFDPKENYNALLMEIRLLLFLIMKLVRDGQKING